MKPKENKFPKQVVILTAKQKRVLDALVVWTRAHDGRPPTLDELRIDLGYGNTSSVQRHMSALLKKGMVRREFHKSRSYTASHLHFKVVPATWAYEIEHEPQACPRCEGQKYDKGSCGLCDNTGKMSEAIRGE